MGAVMKIAVGNDHRGVGVKSRIIGLLRDLGHDVVDLGACSAAASADYPDSALLVARQIGSGQAERGLLICATGHGMCIAANKVAGVRAANCRDLIDAELSRRHNDANILCLSADLIGEELIEKIIRTWLETDFEGGRHARRLEKIANYERECQHSKSSPPPAK
jgi:ribose 5-phosphate isomerase B